MGVSSDALVPDRAHYGPGQAVSIELASPSAGGELVVTRLERRVRSVAVAAGQDRVQLGDFAPGGYGVRLGDATTAFDVLADPFERPRYGFIVELTDPARIPEVVRTFRRLHLDAAQLYDWAYRHAQLLPPAQHYLDPLGQPRDLAVVDAMSRALAEAGVVPLGYSAVYAIGSAEIAEWGDSVILRSDGEPYRLGDDFLVLVDPAGPRWLAHYLGQLDAALRGTALAGFHLDQYGWPKLARRADGAQVDLAASFDTLLHAIRRELPHARYMFNNVNDFPTAVTARTPQDATYIEVWPPHTTLQDLARLATSARAVQPTRPPILSAYLSCFRGGEERAVHAAELVMATAFSHGASHLLLGEDGAALTDPYYPHHHRLSAEALDAFVPWYDFAVRYGDLLYDPASSDVTESFTGGINGDVTVEGGGIRSSTKAEPGTLWTRVVRTPHGLVVHLVNLVDQTVAEWDAEKEAPTPLTGLRLGIAPAGPQTRLRFATVDAPDAALLHAGAMDASTQSDALTAAQSVVWFELPPFRVWAVIWVPFEELA